MPVLLLALAEGATGIAQKLLGVTVQGTYGNRNHFAALIAAALPFALSGALYLMGRRLAGRALRSGEALAGLCVVPCVSVLAISGIWSLSRMGFIAMAASIAVVGWHALRRQTGRPVLSAALLSGALFTGMAAMAPAELIERFALTNDLQAGDNRISLWRESLELVKASPLVGSGLGAYEPAFLRYKRVAPDRSADFAHNDFLQLSAELGLAGVALIVVAVSRLLVPLLRRAYCGSDGSQWLRVACLASLVGMGLHSASDYPLYVPGNLVLTAWVGGIAAFQIAKVKPAVSETDV
jgi:O-antigen ligase